MMLRFPLIVIDLAAKYTIYDIAVFKYAESQLLHNHMYEVLTFMTNQNCHTF